MNSKKILAMGMLVWGVAPLAMAGAKVAYPTENVAAFVVDKLDVTSLPAGLRPEKEKGKKTLAEYGYQVQKLDERAALVQRGGESAALAIKVLELKSSGIYVCVSRANTEAGDRPAQSVVLLKSKVADGLLKSRETSSEFAGCATPVGSSYNAIPSLYPAD